MKKGRLGVRLTKKYFGVVYRQKKKPLTYIEREGKNGPTFAIKNKSGIFRR